MLESVSLSTAACALAVLAVLWALVQWWRSVLHPDPKNRLPVPPGERGPPIVGSTLRFMSGFRDFANAGHRRYGDVWWTNILGEPHVFVSGGAGVRAVYLGEGRCVQNEWTPTHLALLGDSLPTQVGETHAKFRPIYTKAFSPEALHNVYAPSMQEIIRRFLSDWAEKGVVAGSPGAIVGDAPTPGLVSGYKLSEAFSYDVAQKLITGLAFPDEEQQRLREAMAAYGLGLFSVPVDLPFTTFGKAVRARDLSRDVIRRAVREKRAQLDEGADPGGDVIARLMAEYDEGVISEESYVLQAHIAIYAGFDTTCSALVAVLRDTAERPEVRERIREEQRRVVASHGAGPSSLEGAALEEMPYLDAVVKESMRVNTTVAFAFKRVTQTFEIDGYQVPRGAKVVCNLENTHHVSRGIADPEKYDPMRYMRNDPGTADGWVGYGFGKRMCVGYPLANLEMRMFVAMLARDYDWSLATPDGEWNMNPFPVPKNGLPLRLTRVADSVVAP